MTDRIAETSPRQEARVAGVAYLIVFVLAVFANFRGSFGIHLVLLGYLVIKSGYVSRVLGFVLMVAGAAYVIDTMANALLANYDDFEAVFLIMVAVPSVIGELWLGLWLLLKAGKVRKRRSKPFESRKKREPPQAPASPLQKNGPAGGAPQREP
jgi:hypothetical protein